MGTRVLSALVGIPLFLVPLYLGGWALYILVLLLALLGLREFVALFRSQGYHLQSIVMTAAIFLLLTEAFLWQGAYTGAVLFLVLAVLALQLILSPHLSVIDFLASFLGTVYLGWLWEHLLLIRAWPQGFPYALLAVGTTWIFDITAYFGGLMFGKHKLLPRVSPNKTVEGSITGTLFVILFLQLAGRYLGINPVLSLVLAVTGSILAQVGDLWESVLKRWSQVKDSGGLIPGHGGILDRFDSFLFVIPAFYYLLAIFWAFRV